MYKAFYGLKSDPFKLSPDHRFFFESRTHKKAIAFLNFGLEQGEGFIVITGPVGAGKSTLMGQLFAQLDTSRVVAAQIVTTQIDADDTVRLILGAFKLESHGTDKASMLRTLENFLVQQHRARRRVLMVVDEAQNLPRRTLEELRMLSNFTAGGQALFQCFLLGQPQFVDVMMDPDLEQLRQRVIASYHLEPMSATETRQYIEHRLSMVGWRNDPAIEDAAYAIIHEETGGIPRLVNLLCNRLFLLGALEERHSLDAEAVGQVVEDMRTELAGGPRRMAQVAAPAVSVPVTPAAAVSDDARLKAMEERMARQERALRDLVETAIGLLPAAAVADKPLEEVEHD